MDNKVSESEIDRDLRFSIAAEKETIINFNNAEQEASYYTLNLNKRAQILQLAEEYPDDVHIIRQSDDMVEATLPKKWIKIRPPRKLTDEEREIMVERGKKLAEYAKAKAAANNN